MNQSKHYLSYGKLQNWTGYFLACYDPINKKLRFTNELAVEDENNLLLQHYTENVTETYDFADYKLHFAVIKVECNPLNLSVGAEMFMIPLL